MRTKHILTALAIPALFAACVADDFNEAVTGSDMAQRALLSEDFKLNFDGADTRFDAGEGSGLSFSYETGDKIGGAIIDEFSYGDDKEKVFTVVPYVSTNHPFVRNAQGEWTIEHTMVEGNYLFYFPYNENNHARTAPMYSIPVMQDLSGKDGKFDPKAAVEKYSMAVGAQFLDKEDLSASLQLVNIFGYARIKVVVDNHYAGGEVDKIVLRTKDNEPFKLSGQISNITVSNLYENLETSTTDYQNALNAMTATEDFAIAQDSKQEDEASYYEEALNQTSTVIVGKAPEGTALVEDAQRNKTFETYLVVPATGNEKYDKPEDIKKRDIEVYLYTTDGDIYVGEIKDFYVARNGVNGETVTVQEAKSVPYVVTSEADWNNNVAMLSKNQNGENAAVFIIANEDFAITNNTKFPTNGAEIKVSGELKVAGNNVTIKNVTASEVIVEKGAKLTTDGTFSAESIENNGTLEFAVVYDEKDEDLILDYGSDVPGVKNVTNMPGATLNILEDAEVTFYLNNKCDKKSAELAHGTVNVDGMLTLDDNNGSVSENDGDIVVAENGSLRGYFKNWDKKHYPMNEADEEKWTKVYTPTITNNGEIFITEGTAENYGIIVNNKGSEISCSKTGGSAKFENMNLGSINVADGSRLLITANDGEVILNKLDQTNWKIEDSERQGTVAYKTNSADNGKSYDFTATGKGITKLYVTGDLGITKYGEMKNIVMTGEAEDATLALPKDATLGGTLTIEEGANVAVDSEKATLTNLTIEKGATMTVNEDNEMVVNGTIDNKGTVYVGGKFNAPNTEEAKAGEFRNTSSDSEAIKFKEDQPDTNKVAFETALKALPEAYANNSGEIGTRINTWSELKVANVAACGWTETGWMEAPFKAVTDAYQAWKGHAYTVDYKNYEEFLNSGICKAALEQGINDARTKADAALEATFAELTPETWLSTNVYVKADTNAKILNATDNETELVAGFAAYVKGTAYDSYKSGSKKAVWLSAESYNDATNKAAEADVPAYSYIHGYAAGVANQHDYEVMKAMKSLAARNFSWFKKEADGSGNALAETDFKSYKVISDAMTLINNLYNTTGGMSPTDRKLVENSKVLDYFDEVMEDWLYTESSLTKLNGIVQ